MNSFWSIPPIQDAIAAHLSPHEFAQCALVSHAFFQFATPFLWRTVEVQGSEFDFTVPMTLCKQHLHVRDLRLNHIWPGFNSSRDGSLFCPHLESFAVSLDDADESATKGIVTLLESHSGLCTLEINHWSAPSILDSTQLWRAIQDHPRLERVGLDFTDVMSGELLIRILQTFHLSRRLTKASLNIARMDNNALQDFATSFPSLFQGDCALQELEIHIPQNWSFKLIQELLKHCPHLRHFSLKQWALREINAVDVARILASHCPQLESLALNTANRSIRMGLIVQELPGLKRLALALAFRSNTGIRVDLEHQTSLEHLDLSRREFVTFMRLGIIANKCPKLQTLKAFVNMEDRTFWPLADYCHMTWPFTALRVLDLKLQYEYKSLHPFSILYDWIASLTQLEQLALRGGRLDGKFVERFREELPKLRSLMRLVEFTTTGWPEQAMTTSDVEQMVEVWPKLLKLAVGGSPEYLVPRTEFREQLRLRRPWLKIVRNQ